MPSTRPTCACLRCTMRTPERLSRNGAFSDAVAEQQCTGSSHCPPAAQKDSAGCRVCLLPGLHALCAAHTRLLPLYPAAPTLRHRRSLSMSSPVLLSGIRRAGAYGCFAAVVLFASALSGPCSSGTRCSLWRPVYRMGSWQSASATGCCKVTYHKRASL